MDKRVERSKAKVLAETYRQLAQGGIAGVSVDEVSRISGVSKTTIYRHWPSRSALLIDACSRLGATPVAPDTGSLRGDARALLSHLVHQLRTANWSSVYPSIIDAAERDAELQTMQAALHATFMAPFKAVIERAKAKGEIPRERAMDDVVALLVGPLFFRRWFAREEMDDRFIDAIIDAATR
ncbi:TetR/AcrR family transcriptional regulator [Nitrospirillum sp. BR 11164]|uniref:TetR/AcrR family transcriptional regulator n=1 Tax=Nitrospirillum sp. BR 11164 TaxID=3104324 RepID=UPI002AFEB859|nr:TetR/AcrR family transcriptional regulator [Nitrospirillum sp. BR 11164]MEA1650355.1 TetR/AcrR family transcriptional regulator [Nitrospirillum sp. BR 11164]